MSDQIPTEEAAYLRFAPSSVFRLLSESKNIEAPVTTTGTFEVCARFQKS